MIGKKFQVNKNCLKIPRLQINCLDCIEDIKKTKIEYNNPDYTFCLKCYEYVENDKMSKKVLSNCQECVRDYNKKQKEKDRQKFNIDRECSTCTEFKTALEFTDGERQCKKCRLDKRHLSKNENVEFEKQLKIIKSQIGFQKCKGNCQQLKNLEMFTIRTDTITPSRRNICKTCISEKGYNIKYINKQIELNYKMYRERQKQYAKTFRELNPTAILKHRKQCSENLKLKDLKNSAMNRNIYWEENDELIFNEMLKQTCYYCNDNNCISLDRIDSTQGYIISNTVPCCKICNHMKGFLDLETFLVKTNLISKNNIYYDNNLKLTSKFTDNGNKVPKGNPSYSPTFFGKECYLCKKSSNGIDRFNPNLDYTIKDNLRPCCTECNYIKKDFWPFESFINHIHKIDKLIKIDIDKIIEEISKDDLVDTRPIKKRKTNKTSFNLNDNIIYVYFYNKIVAKFQSKKEFCNTININVNGKNIKNGQIDKIVLPENYSYCVDTLNDYSILKQEYSKFNEMCINIDEYENFLKDCRKTRNSYHYQRQIILHNETNKIAYIGAKKQLTIILHTKNLKSKISPTFRIEDFDWSNEFHLEDVDLECQQILHKLGKL